MCLDDQILSTYIDGELEEPWKSQVEEHLDYCSACKERYESLQKLKEKIKDSVLTQDEITSRKERVEQLLDKNYLNKKHKPNRFIRLPLKWFGIGTAAAFVLIFAGSFALGRNKNTSSVIPVPDIYSVDIENITPIRATDNNTTSKTLESYSLDEILKNLDARGYDIEIRLKDIQPITFDFQNNLIEVEEEVPENQTENLN